MNQDTNMSEKVTNAKGRAGDFMKSRMFDITAAGIVVAMAALTLGMFELREITFLELVNILLETLPFYLANHLLTMNYYNKGVFTGKKNKSFLGVVNTYSAKVNALTGDEIGKLPEFCEQYNERVLVNLQTSILKTEALTYQEFDVDYTEIIGDQPVSHGPLRALSKHDLEHLLGKERAKVVIKAKKLKIKGLRVNVLLGSQDNADVTNLGPGEKDLTKKRNLGYAVTGFLSIFVLTLIGVKNVYEWGWMSLLFMIFKLLYIVCRSFMRYFDGYQDITVSLANHISRKTDIIKEFDSWYGKNISSVGPVINSDGNISDNSSYNI